MYSWKKESTMRSLVIAKTLRDHGYCSGKSQQEG